MGRALDPIVASRPLWELFPVGRSRLAGQLQHGASSAPAAGAVDVLQQMQGTPVGAALHSEQQQEQQKPTPGAASQIDPFADDPGDWEPTQQELYSTPHAATPYSAISRQPSAGLAGEKQHSCQSEPQLQQEQSQLGQQPVLQQQTVAAAAGTPRGSAPLCQQLAEQHEALSPWREQHQLKQRHAADEAVRRLHAAAASQAATIPDSEEETEAQQQHGLQGDDADDPADADFADITGQTSQSDDDEGDDDYDGAEESGAACRKAHKTPGKAKRRHSKEHKQLQQQHRSQQPGTPSRGAPHMPPGKLVEPSPNAKQQGLLQSWNKIKQQQQQRQPASPFLQEQQPASAAASDGAGADGAAEVQHPAVQQADGVRRRLGPGLDAACKPDAAGGQEVILLDSEGERECCAAGQQEQVSGVMQQRQQQQTRVSPQSVAVGASQLPGVMPHLAGSQQQQVKRSLKLLRRPVPASSQQQPQAAAAAAISHQQQVEQPRQQQQEAAGAQQHMNGAGGIDAMDVDGGDELLAGQLHSSSTSGPPCKRSTVVQPACQSTAVTAVPTADGEEAHAKQQQHQHGGKVGRPTGKRDRVPADTGRKQISEQAPSPAEDAVAAATAGGGVEEAAGVAKPPPPQQRQQQQQRKRRAKGTGASRGKRQRSTSADSAAAAAAAASAAAAGVNDGAAQAGAEQAAPQLAARHNRAGKAKQHQGQQKDTAGAAAAGRRSRSPDSAAGTAAASGLQLPPSAFTLLDSRHLRCWPDLPVDAVDWLPPLSDALRQHMQRVVQAPSAAGVASQTDFDSQSTNASLGFGLTQQQQLGSTQLLQLEPPMLLKLYNRRCSRAGSAAVRKPDGDSAYQYAAAGALHAQQQQQQQVLSAEEVAQRVAEQRGSYSWHDVEPMSICLAEREGERLVFYPLKDCYQKLLGDAEQRGPGTAAKILVAQADACHPCNFSPLGQLITEVQALAGPQPGSPATNPAAAREQQQQQHENRRRMLLAGTGLECCEFLGLYVTNQHRGLLRSQLDARTNADLTYEAATEAYEMEFPITEVGGDQAVLLANPDTALLALINSMHCWTLEKEERGMRCPRLADGACSCSLYRCRRANVVLLQCLYKAADSSAVLAPLFFTARDVAQHEELLWNYEDGSGSYFSMQLANMRQRLVLQSGEQDSQALYSCLLEKLQDAQAAVQQALTALQQPPCTAAAVAERQSPAAPPPAVTASTAAGLAAKSRIAIQHMQYVLHKQHIVLHANSDSLIDHALLSRACDASAERTALLPAATGRITRGSGKQQQAHKQRRSIRSDPVAAVLAVGKSLQQGCSDVQLLPGEQLGMHLHGNFERLAQQLHQQQEHESKAQEVMQQLEVLLGQLLQQCEAAARAAETAAAVAAAAGIAEEQADGEAAAAAAADRQQHVGDNGDREGGGALQAQSSGTAGVTAAAAADADSVHAGQLAAARALRQCAAPVDAAAITATVSSAEEQYAADKMAALTSADALANALRQENVQLKQEKVQLQQEKVQLEQEKALLRQQLAAAQQAAQLPL